MHKSLMVHIVDDDNAVRDALALLMATEDIPARTYESAEDFLSHGESIKPGCLLLDVRMPGMNGLQLLELLRKKDILIPVIFITGHGDVSMAVEAMKNGATDFIEKPFNNERLLQVIANCLTKCIDLDAKNHHRIEIMNQLATLTRREREVMKLLVEGKKNKVIANELCISPRTVELHRAKVMEKLHAHSLSEIVKASIMSDEV